MQGHTANERRRPIRATSTYANSNDGYFLVSEWIFKKTIIYVLITERPFQRYFIRANLMTNQATVGSESSSVASDRLWAAPYSNGYKREENVNFSELFSTHMRGGGGEGSSSEPSPPPDPPPPRYALGIQNVTLERKRKGEERERRIDRGV